MKPRKKIILAVITLGITSMLAQLLAIREFLSIFYGNELVIGIILANWLMLTGLGSYLGRYIGKIKKKVRVLITAQIIIAFLPLVMIYSIRFFRNIIFLPGELISPTSIFLFSLFILAPFCLITGFLLTLTASIISFRKDAEQIGKVYFWDSIGDIIGGILFSFILIHLLNPFQTAFVLVLFNLIAVFLIGKKTMKIFTVMIFLIILPIFFNSDLNMMSAKKLFPNQEIIEQVDSKYGKIIVTETSGQLNFFENGILLFSYENTIDNEEKVHYAMVQHKSPKNILLISGGISGTAKEILKYDVDKIDYLELDPNIISIGKEYTSNIDDEKINIINKDGRLFVKQTNEKYDVAIIDLPDPSTTQINRFYTIEFFKELKKKLDEESLISISVSSSENYMNEETIKLNSIIYSTLKEVFDNVIIIPGEENFFISSDKKLSYEISGLTEKKNIETKYVNKDYLIGKITEERINYVKENIKQTEEVNKDFNPIAYYYQIKSWKTKFESNTAWILIIALLIILILITRLKAMTFSVSVIGFSAISLELVLLTGFQIIYGYIYGMLSIIITLFMMGLAIGIYSMNKTLQKRKAKDFLKIQMLIIVYSTLLPLILIYLSLLKNELLISLSANVIIPLLTILLGFLTGSVFPLVSKLTFKRIEKTASKLYSADLIGSCLGAILTSVVLIPVLGITKLCFLIAGINLISFVRVLKK